MKVTCSLTDNKHGHANKGYLEEGVKLLELVQHAVSKYKMLDSSKKGNIPENRTLEPALEGWPAGARISRTLKSYSWK